jgi:hypothetical protein
MDEESRINENVGAVKKYLAEQFPGFELNDRPDKPIRYTFTVNDGKQLFKLLVSWPRLSDATYNPTKTDRLLRQGDVSDKMRSRGEEGYTWG